MKAPGTRCIIATLLFALAGFVFAGDFKSEIITGGHFLTINLSDDHFLVIRNFTQEGGTGRGLVTVMTTAGLTANVLAATIIDSGTSPAPTATPSPTPTPLPLEVINNVVVAGPATITVTCPTDATTCFVSYKKDSD